MGNEVRRLQLVELDILKQVLEVIRKHGLTYYMLGGTLLGAVRHQGFIPWDDDIDIGLPRPDYERFLECAQRELKLPYQLHTLKNENGEYSYYYARIENTEQRVLRKSSLKSVVIPVWIDVFPLDGVPDEKWKEKLWFGRCSFAMQVFKLSQFSYFTSSKERKISRKPWKAAVRQIAISMRIERLIPVKWAWRMLDRALKSCRYEESERLINFCGYWGIKEMFPKTVYGEGRLYPFEDLMLNGPINYDCVLTQMYGDYMTPPPEDKREHHFIELLTADDLERNTNGD